MSAVLPKSGFVRRPFECGFAEGRLDAAAFLRPIFPNPGLTRHSEFVFSPKSWFQRHFEIGSAHVGLVPAF